ncbi:MAG: cobaltochelatase subunit CobN [Deltaproteobacteria bacterium]|jgi:cobaltochelatase CobN|nr:cobaltochelatase subunit CobN [Deltaproteobacteria bacterium]
MLITAIIPAGFHTLMTQAAKSLKEHELKVYPARLLRDAQKMAKATYDLKRSDAVLVQQTEDSIWGEIKEAVGALSVPVAWLDMSGAPGASSGVTPKNLADIYFLMAYGGLNNAQSLWQLLLGLASGTEAEIQVEKSPSLGFWHPMAPLRSYSDAQSYLEFYAPYSKEKSLGSSTVGLIMHRHFWNVDRPEVEEAIIEALEARGLGVWCMFIDQGLEESVDVLSWLKDNLIDETGKSKIALLIKLTALLSLGVEGENDEKQAPKDIFNDSPSGPTVNFYQKLGVPVFQPAVSHRLSLKQWEEDPSGLGPEVSWSMTLPEFEGVIEPMFIGGTESDALILGEGSARKPHLQRIGHLADRASKWAELSATPIKDRKIALILHNAPCASVEATVGTASQLDALESVVQIGRYLKNLGYQIEVPENGRVLLDTIMSRKAISEFRWTTVEEIVGKGGALTKVPLEDYLKWYEKFPDTVKASLCETWGDPPGKVVDDVPAAMVLGEDIIVPGISLGPKAVLLVQPKRGCAGSRCDGRVCRILHDPTIPPPHQYLATYRYLSDRILGFGAHALIHVGTHGNLEYLPGKSLGLSEACLPDLALGTMPHLYIYNCAVTADGLMAKRRSYATLIDHLQTVMTRANLNSEAAELYDLIGQWERSESGERRKALEDLIEDKLKVSPMARDLPPISEGYAQRVRSLKSILLTIEGSLVEEGLHIYGQNPQDESLDKLVSSALRFGSNDKLPLRSLMAKALGLDFSALLNNPDLELKGAGRRLTALEVSSIIEIEAGKLMAGFFKGISLAQGLGESLGGGALAPLSELTCDPVLEATRSSPNILDLRAIEERALNLKARLESSDELGALADSLAAGFVSPGPSGLLDRGFDRVVPTGRNFYSRDPRRVPTRAAAEVGRRLAQASVDKFLAEEGRYPKNIAFFWISSDLLQADGEVFAQMLFLMGLRPAWDAAGLVSGFEVIPLEELKRPRIDVTCRMSGIIRDCFRASYEYLDRGVKLVAELDEPAELNYVRARSLEALKIDQKNNPDIGETLDSSDSSRAKLYQSAWRRATSRVFSQAPGSFESGTYLAVMASAWETEADLAEIFVHHHSYAYGSDSYGLAAPDLFERQLGKVDLNMLNVHDDHQDFLGCGGFFGAQGGLAQAAGYFQKRKVKSYVADTRETGAPVIRTLSAEINRCFQTRLLNPHWVENMIKHGHKGAAEISRRVTNAFGWSATTGEVDGASFDGLVRSFFLDEKVREFFEKNNPWALEEIGRRLLEAESRGLWQPDPDLIISLKERYLALEGVLEEGTETFGGDLQGGAVDIITSSQITKWRQKMDDYRRRAGLGQIAQDA